jgi:hypothetical protein
MGILEKFIQEHSFDDVKITVGNYKMYYEAFTSEWIILHKSTLNGHIQTIVTKYSSLEEALSFLETIM